MSTTYVFLAPGFEEIEAIAPVDLMRRAGIDVMTVAVGESRHVTGAHGITVEADLLIDDEDMGNADLLVAPGGMPGAKNLAASPEVCQLFKTQAEQGRLVAAICAAPAVLLAHIGILKGLKATCYPGFDDDLRAGGATYVTDERVVRDGNIITSNGPSSALQFGLALVEALRPLHSREVAAGILM
ncbi:MAG: DJ-1/PfpI family protein [Muribaculaceae bacterium]|nr:DJ-1/PfpI family protein [Muribaculaceae bacterium]